MKTCTTHCQECGKVLCGGSLCKKCANASFAHFENQLRDSAGSVVDTADVAATCDADLAPEIVPLC